jgi:hypothetical protein
MRLQLSVEILFDLLLQKWKKKITLKFKVDLDFYTSSVFDLNKTHSGKKWTNIFKIAL